jgi:hypothetical protein
MGEDHLEIKFVTHPNDKKGRPVPKKNPEVTRSYARIVKRYIKLCYGFKIDNDDFQEWLTIPVDDRDDEEPKPFLKDGLNSIQEITIVKIMVQNLEEYCLGKQKEFKI